MKTLRVPLALLVLAGVFVRAQDPVPLVTANPAVPSDMRRTPEQLEQLLAPIALYPDALLAIILPAATAPADIVLAARYVREFPNDHSQIEHRAWDESVKSLTFYPDVLRWMDENLDWTKQVGEAFTDQPAEVMQTMQRLRAKARAAGTLVDTPQQQVIAEPDVIRIVPTNPDVIYVPYYQPEVVFVDRPVYYSPYYSPSYLSFGIGVPVGAWLAFECDWRHHSIWVGNRHRPWTGHDWRRPLIAPVTVIAGSSYSRTSEVRQWRPPPAAPRRTFTAVRSYNNDVPRPAPISATFARPSGSRGSFSSESRSAWNQSTPNPTAPAQTVAPAQNTSSPGHRSMMSRTASNLASAPAVAPTAPAVVSTPPPVTRDTSSDRTFDNTPRNRRDRSTQVQTAPAAQSFTPAPAAPSQPAPADVPSRNRSYRNAAAATYSAPMSQAVGAAAVPSPAPSSVVAPQRSYQHYSPPAQAAQAQQAAPRSVPVPSHRAPAPEVAAPAASTPSNPPSSPPPARSDNGNGRGRDRRDSN